MTVGGGQNQPEHDPTDSEITESFPVAPAEDTSSTRQPVAALSLPFDDRLPQEADPYPPDVIDRVILLAPGLIEPYIIRGFHALGEERFLDAAVDLGRAVGAGSRDPFAILELARLTSPRFVAETGPIVTSHDHAALLERAEEVGSGMDDITWLVRMERACTDPAAYPELARSMAQLRLRTRRDPVRRIVEASVISAYPDVRSREGYESAGRLLQWALTVAPGDATLRFLEFLHVQNEKSTQQVQWRGMAEALFQAPLDDHSNGESRRQDSATQFARAGLRVLLRQLRPLHGVRRLRRPTLVD